MSILQDPVAALAQAEWYLDHPEQELFPGAFELAAGNVCRQTLEQALLVACFFSGMSRSQYVKPDGRLQTAGRLLRELKKIDPGSGRSYWVMAGRRGTRIGKRAALASAVGDVWWVLERKFPQQAADAQIQVRAGWGHESTNTRPRRIKWSTVTLDQACAEASAVSRLVASSRLPPAFAAGTKCAHRCAHHPRVIARFPEHS